MIFSLRLIFFKVRMRVYIYFNILVRFQYIYTFEFQQNKSMEKSLEKNYHISIRNSVRNRFPMSLRKWFFGANFSLHKITQKRDTAWNSSFEMSSFSVIVKLDSK